MWGPDVHQIPPYEALKQFTFAFSLFGGIMLFSYLVTPTKPVVPREYPFDGLVKELGGLEENKVSSCLSFTYLLWGHHTNAILSCFAIGLNLLGSSLALVSGAGGIVGGGRGVMKQTK